MGRAFLSIGLGALPVLVAVLIAKSQSDPKGVWGWILTNPHVVPALVAWLLLCFAVGLGQWRRAHNVYWAVFAWLFPPADGIRQWKSANDGSKKAPEILSPNIVLTVSEGVIVPKPTDAPSIVAIQTNLVLLLNVAAQNNDRQNLVRTLRRWELCLRMDGLDILGERRSFARHYHGEGAPSIRNPHHDRPW